MDLLVAPRRIVLDTILADAAIASGAAVRTSTAVTDVIRDDTGRVTGSSGPRTPRPRPLPVRPPRRGGDGLRSTLAPRLGAATRQTFSADVSLYYTYVDQVPWRGFEFHIAPGAFAGVFPTHDGQACVWLSRPPASSRAYAGRRTSDRGLDGRDRGGRALARAAHQVGAGSLDVRGIIAPPNYVRTPSDPAGPRR